MGKTDYTFAKEQLTPAIRFIAALKATSKRFMPTKGHSWSAPAILFGLMNSLEDYPTMLPARQKNIIAGTSFSKETEAEMRYWFLQAYNDEEFLLAFLNKQVSDASMRMYFRESDTDEEVSKKMVKDIIQSDLLNDLDL
ncbi:hypothetical protein PG299_02595 [Riemerella anatipestifer]|nr:hypothetical protein [Riemerella anatipestifer]